MKLANFFMYDVDGVNARNATSQAQEPKQQQVEQTAKQATPAKKPNLWQRIKSELQAWSNKDAQDSAFDDTQV